MHKVPSRGPRTAKIQRFLITMKRPSGRILIFLVDLTEGLFQMCLKVNDLLFIVTRLVVANERTRDMIVHALVWISLFGMPVGIPFTASSAQDEKSRGNQKPQDMPDSLWNALNQEEMADVRELILKHNVVVKFEKLPPNAKGKPTVGRLQKRGKNYTMSFNEDLLQKAPTVVLKQHLAHEGLHLAWRTNAIEDTVINEEVEAFTREAKIWRKVKTTWKDRICDQAESFVFNEEGQLREDWEIAGHLKKLGYRNSRSILESQEHIHDHSSEADGLSLELGALGWRPFDFDATLKLTAAVTYLGLPHDATVKAEDYDAWLGGVTLGLDLKNYFKLNFAWATGGGDGTGSASLTDGTNTDSGTFDYKVDVSMFSFSIQRAFDILPPTEEFNFGPYLGVGLTYQRATYKDLKIVTASETVPLSGTETETDFIGTGSAGLRASWKISDRFHLSLGGGITGYAGFGAAAEATFGGSYSF